MHLIIASRTDALRVRSLATWLGRPPVSHVSLRAADLDQASLEATSNRMRRYFNDCGCGWASTTALAVLVGIFVLWSPITQAMGILLPTTVAVFAPVIAKLAALGWSCLRLRRLIDELSF